MAIQRTDGGRPDFKYETPAVKIYKTDQTTSGGAADFASMPVFWLRAETDFSRTQLQSGVMP